VPQRRRGHTRSRLAHMLLPSDADSAHRGPGGVCAAIAGPAGHHGNVRPWFLVVETILSVTDLRSEIAPSAGAGYDRHAARYDHNTGHFNEYRKRAASALRLRPGETVLDVGCGTGLCFPWIQDCIGPSGKLIAV